MSATSLTVFFGDAEHRFDFDGTLLGELEALTDAGIGALFKRLVDRTFRYGDLLAVLRLGLIGGGTRPEEAARLVKVYGEGRPIEETYPVALHILSALWFGNAEDAAPSPVAEPEPEPQPAPEPVAAPIAEPAPVTILPAAADRVLPAATPQPSPAPWVAPIPGLLMDIGSEF